jgi:predicted DNA-binding transcriptional regulator AlpA
MKPQDLSHSPTPVDALFDPDSLEAERKAADFLGVTTRALQKWRATGTGPKFVRISGRCVRYRRRDLMAWAEARLKSSTSE